MLQTSSKFFARAVAQRVLTGLAAFVLMVAGVAGIAAHAQLSGTGAISGTVVDPTDAVVAGATVTVTNVDTNVSTVRTTRCGPRRGRAITTSRRSSRGRTR